MADFGALAVLIAFVVATYAGAASLVGARQGSARLIRSGQAAIYALAVILGLASVAMVESFAAGDFRIKYVEHYSDAHSSLFYKISAYWGGLDGSLLFWVSLLALFAAIAVYTNRQRHSAILPYAIAVMAVVADFFLYLLIFEKNPFETFLTEIPAAGQGLNPLLQNPYMITHPPALYGGFVGLTIPYAFAMAALISGHLDDDWLRAIRRWTLISWFLLTLGLVLGMIWAYEELGWGGFWAWDPVENAGLLPWLTATPLLHSVKAQERRGLLRRWNFTLVILSFFLTIFGTFMTRSGIVQSVHAFGKDTRLAWIFTLFMAAVLMVSFGLLLARVRALDGGSRIESWLSREAAFLASNWLFLLAAFVVMFATMLPTLSEAVSSERIAVGPQFFNRWMVPIGAALLLLTGWGPLVKWRSTDATEVRRRLVVPVVVTLLVVAVCFAVGLRSSLTAVMMMSLCGFVTAAAAQEIMRGLRARMQKEGPGAAAAHLLFKVRRPYAGYLIHIGVALMFLGFAGQAFQREMTAVLSAGESRTFGKYDLRFEGFSRQQDPQKDMISAEISVSADGNSRRVLRPARWYYQSRPDEPTTEVAILQGLREDLYVTMGSHDLKNGRAGFKVVSNPLVVWMWLGYLLMGVVTLILVAPDGGRTVLRSRRLAMPSAAALAGTGASIAFALLVAKMRIGAPLIIVGSGGLLLGLAGMACYWMLDPFLRQRLTTDADRNQRIEQELQARLAPSPKAEAAE